MPKAYKSKPDILLLFASVCQYIFQPLISLSVAYRFYWRHGDYSSDEHNLLFLAMIVLTILMWSSHYFSIYGDPGYVNPNHFREYAKTYKIYGREKEEIKKHG